MDKLINTEYEILATKIDNITIVNGNMNVKLDGIISLNTSILDNS